MTAAQKQTVINRWNGWHDYLMANCDMAGLEHNNSFWGYLRNDLEWGIASASENAKAATYLNFALDRRWTQLFVPYGQQDGLGGIPAEGSRYGSYQLYYSVVPFVTAGLLGRPLYQESAFFRDAVYYMVYSTLPGPTTRGSIVGYDLFPFSQDDVWPNSSIAPAMEYGNFM